MHSAISTRGANAIKWILGLFSRFVPGLLASDRLSFNTDGVQIQIRSSRVGRSGVKVFEKFPNLFLRNIPVSNLLMGGENGSNGSSFARLTDDLLRSSTPISRGPHIEF